MIYKSLLKYWWSFPKDDSKVKIFYIAIDDFSQFWLSAKLLKETASMALRIEAVAFQRCHGFWAAQSSRMHGQISRGPTTLP